MALIRLKRSKTSIGDIEDLDDDLRHTSASPLAPSPADATEQKRGKRGFSFTELTNRIGIKNTPRRSIDKSHISRPIADSRRPIVVSSCNISLGEVTPPLVISVHSSASSSDRSNLNSVYSSRIASRNPSISRLQLGTSLPSPTPLQIPVTAIPWATGELVDSPLQDIPESPFEAPLEKSAQLFPVAYQGSRKENQKMDPTRLSVQPAGVGTKARAIQQAKEMQNIVAERAKRSGDEPPPYDFYELIGKGAYGRVFKGSVVCG